MYGLNFMNVSYEALTCLLNPVLWIVIIAIVMPERALLATMGPFY